MVFENNHDIIMFETALRASAQSVSLARNRGLLYSILNKSMNLEVVKKGKRKTKDPSIMIH